MPDVILPYLDDFIEPETNVEGNPDWDISQFDDEEGNFDAGKEESEWVFEDIEEASNLIADALNETQESKANELTFSFGNNKGFGDYQLEACMTPEAFKKKFGSKKTTRKPK